MFREFFEQFGPLFESRLVIDKVTRRSLCYTVQSRGFGFVTYEHSADAYKVMDRKLVLGGKEVG